MQLHEDVLDDPAALADVDPSGMLVALATSAAQVRESAFAAAEARVDRLADEGRPRAVVITGVGTAALVGDTLAALCGPSSPVPVVTVRGPELPAWVGATDLVVAISHSGSTSATLTVFDEANRRGARLMTVGAADSPLAIRAEQARAAHVSVRRGPTQRATFWSLAVPVLVAADALRVLSVPAPVIEAAAERLAERAEVCRPSSESFVNPAKSAALDLAGTLPLLWGTSPVGGIAVARFAAQLADNAKYPAVTMPAYDAGHGELPALDGPFGVRPGEERDLDDFFRDRVGDSGERATKLRVVLLRDAEEQPLIAARAQAASDIVEGRGLALTTVTAEGASPLERLASLVGFTDYVSVYLALLLRIDPTPVPFAGDLAERVLA